MTFDAAAAEPRAGVVTGGRSCSDATGPAANEPAVRAGARGVGAGAGVVGGGAETGATNRATAAPETAAAASRSGGVTGALSCSGAAGRAAANEPALRARVRRIGAGVGVLAKGPETGPANCASAAAEAAATATLAAIARSRINNFRSRRGRPSR
jgi:hypothetical protein